MIAKNTSNGVKEHSTESSCTNQLRMKHAKERDTRYQRTNSCTVWPLCPSFLKNLTMGASKNVEKEQKGISLILK
jgi:hypothetical protein